MIGTCSSDSKKKELENIGCDHVINYQKENIKDVISSTYKVRVIPQGELNVHF